MELFLIDAIGPFFRGYEKERINWSKIPFTHLLTEGEEAERQWARIEENMRHFAREVMALGYTAVTLDDLAHLAPHPLHEPEIRHRILALRERFRRVFDLLHREFGLKVFLTSDVMPLTPALEQAFGTDQAAWERYYITLVQEVLDDFPQLEGIILRVGESDGVDVKDPVRTRLHLRDPLETNRLLRHLLPAFEERGKTLILRTWTVGAHRIGDLIWHRGTMAETLEGLDSPNLIVSMKHGESDFFRYLPLNKAFFQVTQKKIIELQARREYEGAGEYPAYIGMACERFAHELRAADGVVGMSVWCQTGGWHRFRRLAFLAGNAHSDVWIRLNVAAAIDVFRHHRSLEDSIARCLGPQHVTDVLPLLRHADTVIDHILYIEEFARQKLFFRRVRIPPLLHVYWDSLFINHAVAKTMRHFVKDTDAAVRSGEAAAALFPEMIRLAREANLPVDDIQHMRDFFALMLLARRYYFLPYEETIAETIRAAKKEYKRRYPSEQRQRYRIKISFVPFKVKRRVLSWVSSLLLRKKRGYRMIDHLFTLHLIGHLFRLFKPRNPKAMPKFLRKSAMGIESLFQ
jgi:hypothetical protein